MKTETTQENPESASLRCGGLVLHPVATCTQCGQTPAELKTEYQPEVIVLAENFGEPYLFGVRCRVCGRVAKGVGRAAAIKRWQDGGHDGDMDGFGNDGDDE